MTMSSREIHLLAGDVDEAVRELRSGYAALEQMGEKALRSTIAVNLAEALFRQGRRDEAEHLAREGLELASSEDIATQIQGRAVRARLLAVNGMYEEADQTAREAVALAEKTDDLFTLGQTYMALAEVLPAAGRREEAIEALGAAADASERKCNMITAAKARTMIASLRPARLRH
jgi:tetratricopeptide (TPR) repeat protein